MPPPFFALFKGGPIGEVLVKYRHQVRFDHICDGQGRYLERRLLAELGLLSPSPQMSDAW